MYLVDVDVLLHATIGDAAHHKTARRWLDERLGGQANTAGLAWPVLVAYVEAMTGPTLLYPPVSSDQAWATVTAWLQAPAAWTPVPGTQQARLVGELLAQIPAVGRSAWAVHLAALAQEHGLTIATSNPTYHHLPGVRHYNPLTGQPRYRPAMAEPA